MYVGPVVVQVVDIIQLEERMVVVHLEVAQVGVAHIMELLQ